MRLERFDLPAPESLGEAVRSVVLTLIENETDLTEKKQRIMIAWECGLLGSDEASDWIVLGGMVEA